MEISKNFSVGSVSAVVVNDQDPESKPQYEVRIETQGGTAFLTGVSAGDTFDVDELIHALIFVKGQINRKGYISPRERHFNRRHTRNESNSPIDQILRGKDPAAVLEVHNTPWYVNTGIGRVRLKDLMRNDIVKAWIELRDNSVFLMCETKTEAKTRIPRIGDTWTKSGIQFEVVDVDPPNPKGADLLFGRVTLQPKDGGAEWEPITLGDFAASGFEFDADEYSGRPEPERFLIGPSSKYEVGTKGILVDGQSHDPIFSEVTVIDRIPVGKDGSVDPEMLKKYPGSYTVYGWD